MKFRIKRIYIAHWREYRYEIQQLFLWWWRKPSDSILQGTFDNCHTAETKLEDWWLQQTTDDIILEKTFD